LDNIVLIEDSREQLGYASEGLFQTAHVVSCLEIGDYSLAGAEGQIAIERKSLPDLIQSLTWERTRFERELKLSRSWHRFYVVCESTPAEIFSGAYRSEATPKAIWETIAAFSIRYCPFLFTGDRRHGAMLTESLLLKYAREHFRVVDSMAKAKKAISKAAAS
jgi:ERCC4-type nuclease